MSLFVFLVIVWWIGFIVLCYGMSITPDRYDIIDMIDDEHSDSEDQIIAHAAKLYNQVEQKAFKWRLSGACITIGSLFAMIGCRVFGFL